MSETALLEIGVEEFPPSCVEETLAQLKKKAEELFIEFRLDYQKIATYGSSRRLILWVEGLSSRQREKIEKEMGPPKAMVLNEKANAGREDGKCSSPRLRSAHQLFTLFQIDALGEGKVLF